MTIVLTPPAGAYLIDNTIECSCFVDPTPPNPVSYRWRVLRFYGFSQYNGQNTSYTPSYYRDFHHIWFYCEVFSNTVPVTEGKKVIEVHGKPLTQLLN